ncbi:hypothetical protein BDW59DRAFT_151657 [Aspergillus cavernicola]|uniref:Uncharacterized protein n=1 Tax=Aspergillus cavernicola TaxID=176166 RepID=A0ABR4HU82_9EURO
MIDEGKVIPVPYRESAYFEMSSGPIRVPPWEMHLYTATDVQKAVSALKRLVNAIEIRLDHQTQSPAAFTPLPWHDPAAFSEQLVPPSTFAYDFLKAISELKIRFRYIAPGIRLPTLSEFLSQSWRGGGSHTLRIFQIQLDDSTRLDPPDKSNPKSPGLYIEQVKPGGEYHFANECRLELPFRVGANGFARQSTGHPLGFNIEDLHPKPEGSRWELYQSGFPTGFTDIRFVQIHKVLLNWAEMVERRDWDVDVDGVTGGIEKFREADTEEHWEKYWIPHSW